MAEPSTPNLLVARLIGACTRWSSRGTLLHLVPQADYERDADRATALCGARLKGISNGWSRPPPETLATCRRCIQRRGALTQDPDIKPARVSKVGLRGELPAKVARIEARVRKLWDQEDALSSPIWERIVECARQLSTAGLEALRQVFPVGSIRPNCGPHAP